jgi:RNA polymerase sigma factor (sigma-70 family)
MALSNKEIIDGLNSHNKEVVEYIYKENYKSAVSFITNNSGNRQDAEDIFHDALIAFYSVLQEKKLKLTCSFSTFFIAICKNLWFKEIDRRYRTKSNIELINYLESSYCKSLKWECENFDEYDINEVVIQYKKDNLFRYHFEQLKDICKKILLMFFEKVPMKDIATATGFNSEKSVKVKKYYCQDELIKNIKDNPEYYKIINEIKNEELGITN